VELGGGWGVDLGGVLGGGGMGTNSPYPPSSLK